MLSVNSPILRSVQSAVSPHKSVLATRGATSRPMVLAPKIMIAAIISFFPIVTNTTRGFKSADARVLDFMRSINATRWQVFAKVQFPTALPFIFAAFRIASSLSLVGAVVAEFYGSDRGLGFLVITSATQLQTDLLFVAIAVLAVLGVGCFSIFGRIERAYGAYQANHEYQR